MLEPESIRTSRTKAIDESWAERLSLLRYNQLLINFEIEPNIEKLELWLEMFGLDPEILQQGLTTDEYRRILQSIILIFKLSGTPKSIELIAQALGATSTRPLYKYVLYYDGEIDYRGDYYYDAGGVYRASAITIEATGVAPENQESFIEKMKKLFELFQPMWIYLEGIEFV
jgi:hypothetical protein